MRLYIGPFEGHYAIDLIVRQDNMMVLRTTIWNQATIAATKYYLQSKAKQFYYYKDFIFSTKITNEEYTELVNMLDTMKMPQRPSMFKPPPYCLVVNIFNISHIEIFLNNMVSYAVRRIYEYRDIFRLMIKDKKFYLVNIPFEDEDDFTFTTEVSEVEAFAVMAIPLIEPMEIEDILNRLSKDKSDVIEELAMRYISTL